MDRIHLHFPIKASRMGVQKILLLTCLFCTLLPAVAQEEREDTIPFGEERRNHQNVLQNASSTTQPRILSLGLPRQSSYILQDGLLSSSFSHFFPSFLSWHWGLGTENLKVTTLDESALEMGEMGYFASTTTRNGADRLEAAAEYTLGQHGRNVFDVFLATPMKHGWSLSLNALQDLDRGSNHLDASYLQQHIKYYKAGLQKKFGDDSGTFNLMYQYMDSYLFNDPTGPFIFNGENTLKRHGDFRLTKDQYIPQVSSFDYVDVKTGEVLSKRLSKDSNAPVHTATLSLDYLFRNNLHFEARTHLKFGENNLTEPNLGNVHYANNFDGFNYTNGVPYMGYFQTRCLTSHQGKYLDNLTTLALKKQFGDHSARLGANIWFTKSSEYGSTTLFAHEVKADPQMLCYSGKSFFGHNLGALYFEGRQSRLALYGQDKWNILPELSVRAGVRLEYNSIRGNAANNLDGDSKNIRTQDWNLGLTNALKTAMDNDKWNGAFSLAGTYLLTDNISLEANVIATQQHAEMWQYEDVFYPSQAPLRTYLLRGGLNFKNEWFDLQSLLTYTRQTSIYDRSLLNNDIFSQWWEHPASYSGPNILPAVYAMHSFGWTTDLISRPFGGFVFHGLLTIRAPRYRNYQLPLFDGTSQTFDVSGKRVVSVPAVEFEFEPSYEWEKWRVWLSARFYGKQYANITNTLSFKPHWETFAGVDFTANKHMAFSLKMVNLLNQKGLSAGMQDAFFATDASAYNLYLASGTFIRPFTLEFKTTLKL